jgi:hypothetical protein
MSRHRSAQRAVAAARPALVRLCLVLAAGSILYAEKPPDVPGLLVRIRDEVLGLPKYPGEDFTRGEFHLGEGDDDTNKTHAVGILIKEEDGGGGSRMTVVVSRLEPSAADPRVRYAKEAKTLVCRFSAKGVEILRSDPEEKELGRLLGDILKAVVDKKNLLNGRGPRPGPPICL